MQRSIKRIIGLDAHSRIREARVMDLAGVVILNQPNPGTAVPVIRPPERDSGKGTSPDFVFAAPYFPWTRL